MRKKLITLGFLSVAIGGYFSVQTPLMATSQPMQNIEVLSKLTKVIGITKEAYVEDLNLTDMVDKMLVGFMSNLDAHSAFLSDQQLKDLRVRTDGEFGGLGIIVGMKNGALTVIAPLDDTPAYKAGVKSGDIILKVDGEPTLEMSIDDAVKIMRGKPDTDIVITVVREGESKPLDIKITRAIINVKSVHTKKILDDELLYVRVASFDQKVTKRVQEELKKHKPKGVVLDLRNNPGGLLDQAVGLSDIFINKGLIVSQKGRIQGENTEYNAKKNSSFDRLPLVTLVNGGSASASEIVSGALQDHKRSIVVGEKTFGKGSVQVVIPISDSEAIKLTTARYYLPSGRTIQAVGVTPDIVVESGSIKKRENSFQLKEAQLKKHLESELEKSDNNSTKEESQEEQSKSDTIDKEALYKDLQLKSATDILKALIITQKGIK